MVVQKLDGGLLRKAIIHGASVLKKNKKLVDALNVFPIPDGDTGTNMSLTMDQAAEELRKLPSDDLKKVADSAAWGSLMGARGNSGVILSQLFRGFAQGISSNKHSISMMELANAYRNGVDAAYHAVMRPVEGTMLTVAREMSEKMLVEAKHTKDLATLFEKVVEYGEKVLEKTPEMLLVLREAKVVDAGGKGLIFIMRGFLEVIKNPELDYCSDIFDSNAQLSKVSKIAGVDMGEIDKIYCTELFIKGNNIDIDELKTELLELGDSLIVIGTDELAKVHVHTNRPGRILESALKWGELSKIKIDNMKIQHQAMLEETEGKKLQEMNNVESIGQTVNRNINVIAVSQGHGLNEIFRSMGADVIEGGQTMNPSTENILSAIQKQDGENTIILPNNKNIIMTAEQVKALSNKNIYVLPTKSIPQGISALLAFNPEISLEENISNMCKSIKNVVTGEVTYAVRDSELNGTKIKQGDILGIQDGKLLIVGDDLEQVMMDLIGNMVTGKDRGIITIYYGSEVEPSSIKCTADKIMAFHDDFDVEYYNGGQNLYYYIISVE